MPLMSARQFSSWILLDELPPLCYLRASTTFSDRMPTREQAECLSRMYICEAGFSPTSTVARPGTIPFLASFFTLCAGLGLDLCCQGFSIDYHIRSDPLSESLQARSG